VSYPTIQQVEAASHEQVCRWYRFLPSPGTSAIGREDGSFEEAMVAEKVVMDRICQRLDELGGFTSQISKKIGWG